MAITKAMTKTDKPQASWLKRSLWLIAIWTASVAVMGVLAWLMRGLMRLIGLGN